MIRWHRDIALIHQFNVEDEIGLCWNAWMRLVRPRTPERAVGQLPGDEKTALAADLHSRKALVKPRNHAAQALGEADGLRLANRDLAVGTPDHVAVFIENRLAGVVVGGVELVSVSRQPSGVMDLVHLSWFSIGAGADLDVLVAQRESRNRRTLYRWHSRGHVDANRCRPCDGPGSGSGMGHRFSSSLGNCGGRARRHQQNQRNASHISYCLQPGSSRESKKLFRPEKSAELQLHSASNAASSAVLGARCSTTIDSCGACAPSPTAPKPSRVGTPNAAVKFPSEAPPVDASSSVKPNSAASALALW